MLSLTVVSICLISLVNLTQGITLVTVPSTIVEGESASITCSDIYYTATINKDGVTLPVVTCRIDDNRPCSSPFDYYTISHNTKSLTVHIANASRTRDGGTWICRGFAASDATTATSNSINVDVKAPPPPPTDFGLIGGIAGGAVALILIIIIAVIICKKRRKAAKETERREPSNGKAVETPTREDKMIVDINLDYVSADQLHGASGGARDADGGTVNETSVGHNQKEPVYAKADKSKNSKTNTKLTKDKKQTNQVYAQVDKSKKGEAYKNVGIFGDFKGDPDELTTNKSNNTPQKAEKRKGEDLEYADVAFVAHKPSSGVLRKDEEGGVEYAGIDYTKRGPTPPPPSDSSDDD